MAVNCLESGGIRLYNVHPLWPQDFPQPSRCPSGFALKTSREIYWLSGMYNLGCITHPSSRQCTDAIHPDLRQCTAILASLIHSLGRIRKYIPVKTNPSPVKMRECPILYHDILFYTPDIHSHALTQYTILCYSIPYYKFSILCILVYEYWYRVTLCTFTHTRRSQAAFLTFSITLAFTSDSHRKCIFTQRRLFCWPKTFKSAHLKVLPNFFAYLIFVTGTTGGACVNFFRPV